MTIGPKRRLASAPSTPLIPARRQFAGEHDTTTTASTHLVMCPMVRREVTLALCESCPHGHDWVHDQSTDQMLLRCSYLAADQAL